MIDGLALFGLPIAAVIVALVQAAKELGLPSRYAAPLAIGLGVVAGIIAEMATRDASFASWAEAVLTGIIAGLTAAGIYSGQKAVRGG